MTQKRDSVHAHLTWRSGYQGSAAQVATFTMAKDKADATPMELDEAARGPQLGARQYWGQLLGDAHEADLDLQRQALGKGKRSRREVGLPPLCIRRSACMCGGCM